MGDTLQQWRARVGCFAQPVKSKTHLQTLCINKNSIGIAIRILLFFLLVVQGIESNPGPGSQTGSTGSDVRGRGSGRGSSRGSGRGRGNGRGGQ